MLKKGTIDGSNGSFTIGNIAINTARSPEADYSDIRIYDNVLSSNDLDTVRLENLRPIPEPSGMALWLVEAGLLWGWLRARKNVCIGGK